MGESALQRSGLLRDVRDSAELQEALRYPMRPRVGIELKASGFSSLVQERFYLQIQLVGTLCDEDIENDENEYRELTGSK